MPDFFAFITIYNKFNIMIKKSDKELLFERMEKVDPTFKRRIDEDAFNPAGEPKMTHSQFRDYSEPAEPENDDRDDYNQSPFNPKDILWKELYDLLINDYRNNFTNKSLHVNTITDPDGYGIMDKESLSTLLDTSINIPADWGLDTNSDGTLFLDAQRNNIPTFDEFKNTLIKILNNPEKYQQSRSFGDEERGLKETENVIRNKNGNTTIKEPIIPDAVEVISKNPNVIKFTDKNNFDEFINKQQYFSASHSHSFYSPEEKEEWSQSGGKYTDPDSEQSDIIFNTGRELVGVWDNKNSVGYVVPNNNDENNKELKEDDLPTFNALKVPGESPQQERARLAKQKEEFYKKHGLNPDSSEINTAQKIAKQRGLKEEDESSFNYEIVPCKYGIVDTENDKIVALGGDGNVIYPQEGIDNEQARMIAKQAKESGY